MNMFNDYEMCENGDIFSHKREKKVKLKPFIDRDGYERVALFINKKYNKFYVHRLIALTFIENINAKKEVNHINGNKLDNNVSNLEWVTRSENTKKAYETGLLVAYGKPKLNKEQVKEIRLSNLNKKELSIKYNVSYSCIKHILKNRTWKNI